MNLAVRLSLLALAATGCSGATSGESQAPASLPPATVPDAPERTTHAGDIDSSPRFGQQQNFRVATAGSKRFRRFYIAPFTQTHEVGGVADPTLPSGPANRRFETTEGLSVVAIDGTGQMVPRADLPVPVRELLEHIEAHYGVRSEGGVAKFGEPGFADALIRFAAAEFGLAVETGF